MDCKAVVLLSGGLDSTVNLYAAQKEWGSVMALSFNYGQKAFEQEYKASVYFCRQLDIPHRILDIRSTFAFDQSALTTDESEIPTDSVNLESDEASVKTAEKVWVANRNGVFLNIAACFAESLKAQYVVPGFNKEEAQTFPDNSVEYIQSVSKSFEFSTSNGVKVHCFTQEMYKKEIMGKALEWGVPVEKIWSCYHAYETVCGQCESCQRFDRALKAVKS